MALVRWKGKRTGGGGWRTGGRTWRRREAGGGGRRDESWPGPRQAAGGREGGQAGGQAGGLDTNAEEVIAT